MSADNRLQVRVPPVYRAWLAELGGDAQGARLLLALGALALGFEGAQEEVMIQGAGRLDREVLMRLYDKCTTSVRQVYDKPIATPNEAKEGAVDVFAIGIEV